MIQARSIHRPYGTIYRELDEQHAIVKMLLDLASVFYNIHLPPIVVYADGGHVTVERLGPDPLPIELRENLANERRRLDELRAELALSRNEPLREISFQY